MAKVVIVEDDDSLRGSLGDCLNMMGHEVEGVGSAVEFYQLLASQRFDVAVIDINLPYHDGFSIVSHLSDHSELKIIIASVRDTLPDRVKGYQSGADIYMTKPIDPEELAAAIQSLMGKRRDQAPSSEKTWIFRPRTMDVVAPNGSSFNLTRREARFLGFLLSHTAQVVTRDEVLRALGDDDEEKTRRNLDTLVSRLRAKVKARTGLALPVDTVQGSGFSMRDKVELQEPSPGGGSTT